MGHLALGYITGKATSKLLRVHANVALLFAVSVIPDIDLLLRAFVPGLEHRGPTHSVIILFLLSIPTFVLFGKKAAPYFIALIQHLIVGDIATGGGVQLLWPASAYWYGVGTGMTSLTNILVEWMFFLTSLTLMLKTKDVLTLLQHHWSNLLLSIPVFTVLLPTLLSFPLAVPPELIVPHLIYLVIFSLSLLRDIGSTVRPLTGDV